MNKFVYRRFDRELAPVHHMLIEARDSMGSGNSNNNNNNNNNKKLFVFTLKTNTRIIYSI